MPLDEEVKARIDEAVSVAEEHLDGLLKDPKLRPGVEAMLTLHLAHYNKGTHKYLGQMYKRRAQQIGKGGDGDPPRNDQE